MKQITLFLLLLNTHFLSAQECTQAALAQKPGVWKASTLKGSTTGISAADLAQEKAVLASVHQQIASAYTPVGCQALYATYFGGASPDQAKSWIADKFGYSIYILRYLCDKTSADKSKSYIDAATPTTVRITANEIENLNLRAANLPDDDFRGYLRIKQMPKKKDGYYFLNEEVVGDSHLENKIKQYTWLVTYDDVLPFSYISQKEYLLLTKKRLEKTIKENGASKYYDEFMNRINEHLKRPDSELTRPAICMWNDEENFAGFVAEGTPGSFIAIRPNMAYYHESLKKSAPQFFVVEYKIAHGDVVFENNIAAIQKAVNFDKLRGMLGK